MTRKNNRRALAGRVAGRWARVALMGFAVLAAASERADAQDGEVERTEEVVVSASRITVPAQEVGSAVTVIEAEDLENRQTQSVADILREVPGVAVNRGGGVGTFTQTRIRGAEANQTLVLIDGIRVNDPARSAEFNFGNLMAADIERIEVLRGPQSALYGSDAIGGVISIITKKGGGAPRVSLSGQGGSFATRELSTSASAGDDLARFYAGASHFQTDGTSAAADDLPGVTEEDGYKNTTATLNLGLTPLDNLTFDAVGRFTRAETEFDFPPFDSDGVTDSRQILLTGRAGLTLFDGQWEQSLSADLADTDTETLSGGFPSSSNGQVRTYRYQSNVFLDTPNLARAEHSFIVALEREETEAKGTFIATGSTEELNANSVIGEYRVGLLDRVFLSGSLRFQNNEDLFDDTTTWRTTGAYLHHETGTRLHGSVGTAVKNPILVELFGVPPFVDPNPALKPEKSFGWDLGVEQSFLGGRGSVDVTYFDNRIEDLIIVTSTPSGAFRSENSPGENDIRGIEVSASLEPAEGVTLTGSYTYLDAEDAAGDDLIRRPNHQGAFNANWRFYEERANLNLNLRFTGEQEDTDFSVFPSQRVTLDGYVLVGLAGSYKVFENLEIFGRVENLLDQDGTDVLFTKQPGISAFAGLRLSFGLPNE